MHGHLSWLVELDIKEGQFEAAHSLMEEMVEHTAKEPTSHRYDWYISDDKTVARSTNATTIPRRPIPT